MDRRFPPPWTVDEMNGVCFIVRDKNGKLAIFISRRSRDGQVAAKPLTRDEGAPVGGQLRQAAGAVAQAVAVRRKRKLGQLHRLSFDPDEPWWWRWTILIGSSQPTGRELVLSRDWVPNWPRSSAPGTYSVRQIRFVTTTDVMLFESCQWDAPKSPFFNGSAHAVGKQSRSSKLEKLSHGAPAASVARRVCMHTA